MPAGRKTADSDLQGSARDHLLWARLQRDGETGLAEGVTLLAAMLERFGAMLHPQRERSCKSALE
nr:type VI secretion system ImpA family N-terminal domain-containing protein [Klebsiella pneumoniae]